MFIQVELNVVRTDTGCLEWVGNTVQGRPPYILNEPLARLVCRQAHGEPPTETSQAAHKCHNRLCVEPEHLEWQEKDINGTDWSEEAKRRISEGSRKGALASIKANKKDKDLPVGVRVRYCHAKPPKRKSGWVASVSAGRNHRTNSGAFATREEAVEWALNKRNDLTAAAARDRVQ